MAAPTILLAILAPLVSALQLPSLHAPAAAAIRRATAPAMMSSSLPSDADLFASLRARVELSNKTTASSGTAPRPLGPDEVGADAMGPQDVITYIMQSLQQPSGGGKTLLSFAVKVSRDTGSKAVDHVGQLCPGFFPDPQSLEDYLASHPRYETLTKLEEWKPMGPPDMSDMSRKAAQKLLVRRDGANWEDFFVNMQLAEVAPPEGSAASVTLPTKRWLITSIYKQGTA